MRHLVVLMLLGAASVAAAAEPVPDSAPLSVDQCVEKALASSGKVAEVRGRVKEWQSRVSEARAALFPKLNAMGYVAPMFRVRGNPLSEDVERDYSEWGPYLHFEGLLVQPLYTFGRATAARTAAEERVTVEEAEVARVRTVLAAEVRGYYYLYLYAHSMRPTLATGRKALTEAQTIAEREYEEATGKVTNVDLQKLAYASAELSKYEIQAEVGEGLALAALKHVMGLPDSTPLVLADETMPGLPEQELAPLATFLQRASEQRPEWAQVEHGKKAALSLEASERLANMPVVFAAGQLAADWTPMRPDTPNPYLFDQYNRVTGGVAVGLQINLDPATAAAKGDRAVAMREQVEALEQFAKTGIPVEVRKAWDEASQADRIARVSTKGAIAARKWLLFAGSAMAAGTGEAKDLLEGLVSYLQGKRGEYEALLSAHTARAQLARAVGATGLE